jgi:hypothetical protein
MIRRSAWLFAAALALAFATPRRAPAQAADAAAEALFKEGVAKLDAGDYAAACPMLERAIAASTTEALGGMLTLAECYEKSNRPASAWGLYKKVGARAAAAGQGPRSAEAERAASRLEPTLPRVRFVAPAATPRGLRVRYGTEVVDAAVWGVALPIDPGKIEMTFEAEGRAPKKVEVEIPAEAKVTDVAVPDLETPEGDHDPMPPQREQVEADSGPLGPMGIAGIVIGSVGAAGAIASAVIAADAKSKWDEAVAADCPGGLTECSSLEGIDSARAQGDAGTVAFGVGVGLVAVGAGLLIYDLVTGPSPSGPAVGVAIIPREGGVDAAAAARILTW